MHEESGGAFDGSPTQLAMAANLDYGFGLRCTDEFDLVAIFVTPEQIDQDTLDRMTALLPTVLIRVDDNEPFELPSEGLVAPQGASYLGDAPADLAVQIAGAKTSVSVAISLLGEIYHETRFGSSGSTRAANLVIENCGLDPADS
ncbi:hypothetical protein AN189_07405 [Loktanella sp. 3ANDIMAR09]|nr:hypothetical protein AN189_07405 [Loktanella sp. 3ANDIMAR09]